jgi:FG-GAP repeat
VLGGWCWACGSVYRRDRCVARSCVSCLLRAAKVADRPETARPEDRQDKRHPPDSLRSVNCAPAHPSLSPSTSVGADGGDGAAYVYLGGVGGLSTTPSITFQGPTANGEFGISVAGAGDVNRDGFADVIVGASGVNNSDGAAYLYLGSASGSPASPSSTLDSIVQAGTFGKVVASARVGVLPPKRRPFE